MIFLSDGKVENTEEIRESVIAKNQRLQIPIFSIAFGKEADFQFLHQISEMNKGFARRVYEGYDATQQVFISLSILHMVGENDTRIKTWNIAEVHVGKQIDKV